jgi:predicted ATPase
VLTRLNVKGFKNLLDIDVRFGPFTCVAGSNGVGKSNLFDAIRFLNLLTRFPILQAVQLLRETKGRSPEPSTIFSCFEGFRSSEVSFVAEMIVDRDVEDDFGVRAQAAISTLRYEVRFRLPSKGEAERLELVHESLTPIRVGDAAKEMGFPASKAFKESAFSGVRRGGPFISTVGSSHSPTIKVHQEGHGGRNVPAPKSSRTVLGGTASSDFPTVLAAHREMESWKTLLLEPSAMRSPSYYSDEKRVSPQGGNLPAVLTRLRKSSGPDVLSELANRLSELLSDVHEVRIQDDEKTETLTIQVAGKDGIFHPARSLSDGTLRFLVLSLLALDPSERGTLCLEEPENGIHPERIEAMLRLLKDVAVDSDAAVGGDNPLRQVIVNTHSPLVFRNVESNDLVYLEAVDVSHDGSRGRIAVARVPRRSWRLKYAGPAAVLPPGLVRAFLPDKGQLDLWSEE